MSVLLSCPLTKPVSPGGGGGEGVSVVVSFLTTPVSRMGGWEDTLVSVLLSFPFITPVSAGGES